MNRGRLNSTSTLSTVEACSWSSASARRRIAASFEIDEPLLRREIFVRFVLHLGRRLPVVAGNVGDHIHLLRGQSDQRTRLDQIERMFVMVGYVDVVTDVVKQRRDF